MSELTRCYLHPCSDARCNYLSIDDDENFCCSGQDIAVGHCHYRKNVQGELQEEIERLKSELAAEGEEVKLREVLEMMKDKCKKLPFCSGCIIYKICSCFSHLPSVVDIDETLQTAKQELAKCKEGGENSEYKCN